MSTETENSPAEHFTPDHADRLTLAQVEEVISDVLADTDSSLLHSLELQLRLGEALCKAKVLLPHGGFGPWCENTAKRKHSVCAAHMRLWKDREIAEKALSWATETGHRWCNCYALDRRLKIIADFKKCGRKVHDNAEPEPRNMIANQKQEIAALQFELEVALKDFETLRDQLDPETLEIVAQLMRRLCSKLRRAATLH